MRNLLIAVLLMAAPLQAERPPRRVHHPWDAAVYVQTASDPKEVRWYDTDHFFNDEARKDRMDWLARVLGL